MSAIVHAGRRVPLRPGRSLFDEADELALQVPASCRRTGRCHECIVEVAGGEESLSPRTAEEHFLPPGFRLACQAIVERDDRDVEFAILRRRLRIAVPPVEEPAGLPVAAPLGLAVDLGTTTVVLQLVELASGRVVHAAAFENAQRFGGSDVMSRIAYEAGRPGELRRALRRALNRVLRDAYASLAVDRHAVTEVVVVGNSTMRDLFLGLDVAPLGHWPFRSASESDVLAGRSRTSAVDREAHEVGLFVEPRAHVWGAPLVGSHVGADMAADLVAVSLATVGAPAMVVDIGTNTEVVVTDGRRVLAASCPAGPAFEGGGVRHGMAGAEGAIEAAAWEGDRFACRTIGDAPPEGICGSGLVDLLAESVRAGLLTAAATLPAGRHSIPVLPAAGIDLSPADVSHLAQATSANGCGQAILLRRLGLAPADLERVFLAGAFATAIDVGHAIEIGLLAPVRPDGVVRVSNAALRGATILLLEPAQRVALEELLGRVEHVELEAEPDFFELFVEGCRFEPLQPAPDPRASRRATA